MAKVYTLVLVLKWSMTCLAQTSQAVTGMLSLKDPHKFSSWCWCGSHQPHIKWERVKSWSLVIKPKMAVLPCAPLSYRALFPTLHMAPIAGVCFLRVAGSCKDCANKQTWILVGPPHWVLLRPAVASHGKKMVGMVNQGETGWYTLPHAAGQSGETALQACSKFCGLLAFRIKTWTGLTNCSGQFRTILLSILSSNQEKYPRHCLLPTIDHQIIYEVSFTFTSKLRKEG